MFPTQVGVNRDPAPCSQEMSSVTPRSQHRVNDLMNADETGLVARQVLHSKHWDLKNTGELSEFQAQVIIAVCEGRDEADVVPA